MHFTTFVLQWTSSLLTLRLQALTLPQIHLTLCINARFCRRGKHGHLSHRISMVALQSSLVGARVCRVVPNLHASSSELSAGGPDTIVDDALLSYFRILSPIKVAKIKDFQAVIPHRQDKRARSPVYINIGISTHTFSTELPQSTPGPHLPNRLCNA